MTVSGNGLVVILEPGLHPSRVTGIFARIKQTPGVVSVADLSYVDREVLELMLLPPQVSTNGGRGRKPSKQGALL